MGDERMESDELVPHVDPLVDSIGQLMGVVFAANSSTNYSLAVRVSSKALRYAAVKMDGRLRHFVVFGKERNDASRALALLEMARDWKSLKVFVDGRLLSIPWGALPVLTCYTKALACDDWRAHCYRVIDDPSDESGHRNRREFRVQLGGGGRDAPKPKRFLFPCSYLRTNFRFTSDHPSTPRDQIQAGAVDNGCDWCPCFAAEAYKELEDEPEGGES